MYLPVDVIRLVAPPRASPTESLGEGWYLLSYLTLVWYIPLASISFDNRHRQFQPISLCVSLLLLRYYPQVTTKFRLLI